MHAVDKVRSVESEILGSTLAWIRSQQLERDVKAFRVDVSPSVSRTEFGVRLDMRRWPSDARSAAARSHRTLSEVLTWAMEDVDAKSPRVIPKFTRCSRRSNDSVNKGHRLPSCEKSR
jgi:hypothetical protein